MNPTPSLEERAAILRRVRWTLALFILGLVLSGITAFPLQTELEHLATLRHLDRLAPGGVSNGLDHWLLVVRDGLRETYAEHPWMAYGTDWLAFAHIAIAVFFIGAVIDPVRNIWVLKAGLIACALVIPLALICGAARQIPLGWRLIDCSFGVFGAIPLIFSLRWTRSLENERS